MAQIYTTLDTCIRDHYLPQVVDNIFNSNPLLKLLLGKAKSQRGGQYLRVPIEFVDEGDSQGFYKGYELLNNTQPEILDTARFDWVQAYAAINISGRDEMMNEGPDAIIDLLEARMKNAEKRLKKAFTTKLFAAKGANAADEITSLNDIVAIDRSLGGINSTTETWWDAVLLANGAADLAELKTVLDADFLITDMATQFRKAADGSDSPNLIVTTDEVMAVYESIVGAQARWEGNSILGDAGWTVFRYKGAQMVSDKACTAQQMYFLNTRYLYFKVHPKRNFAFQPFLKPTNQDTQVAYIFWMGQFVCSQPRRQALLSAIPLT